MDTDDRIFRPKAKAGMETRIPAVLPLAAHRRAPGGG